MIVELHRDIELHASECNRFLDVQCRCTCDSTIIFSGDKIVVLRKNDQKVQVLSSDGKIGFTRVGRLKFFRWRMSSVRINNIKNWDGEDLSIVGLLCGLFFLLGFGAYCLCKMATASSEIERCTVTVTAPAGAFESFYVVIGHRSWKPDLPLYYAKTREEADLKKREICPR